jgi:transposase-like protein
MTKKKQSTESVVREIRRRVRRKFSPEEKLRIVLQGLRGEQSVAELCQKEGIAPDRGQIASESGRLATLLLGWVCWNAA